MSSRNTSTVNPVRPAENNNSGGDRSGRAVAERVGDRERSPRRGDSFGAQNEADQPQDEPQETAPKAPLERSVALPTKQMLDCKKNFKEIGRKPKKHGMM